MDEADAITTEGTTLPLLVFIGTVHEGLLGAVSINSVTSFVGYQVDGIARAISCRIRPLEAHHVATHNHGGVEGRC